MKLMLIGSCVINMTNFVSVEARQEDDGVILRIEHEHSINEYMVPNEIDPELVASIVMEWVTTCSRFDLVEILKARRAMIDYDED